MNSEEKETLINELEKLKMVVRCDENGYTNDVYENGNNDAINRAIRVIKRVKS